ncbi:MAG: succinate dehydrogenase, hydrophobic membrane anchor protein [Gammaproteobacteria bacterium]|jgi:succinate dehydrogenase / fumarate reductase, membrane anchor subunit|nr:succinate dehydrogenase, hydrophobic membrane anchor protein [Gammaproteobacteria bacterium]MBT5201896.1 succinate dehydrogenase, hydrophobic membrane anchor protein [Gammaproteobacteria bacterium]MBT6245201.1 succinate dehydrogenase, hydrophobic membrane anchor protein [Gammaproteobacteria bacterium]
MAEQIKGLSKKGILDWRIQRVSSVLLAAYSVLLLGSIIVMPEFDFEAWRSLFLTTWMQMATLIALLAIAAHAWIGMWTIGTDYLSSQNAGSKANRLRYVYQSICLLVLVTYVIWGIRILWGNQ